MLESIKEVTMKFKLGLLMLLISASVNANDCEVTGINVRIGDGVEKIKEEFATIREPDEIKYRPGVGMPTGNGKEYRYGFKDKGITIFLTEKKKVHTLRLESPFSGSVCGAKIGENISNLQKTLGGPMKEPFEFGEYMAHVYRMSNGETIRFDVDESGRIGVIFL